MFEIACGASSQVQPAGQSAFDAHVTVLAEQCDVESVIVVQTVVGGSTGPPSSDGAEPPPEHDPTSSGTHVNPSPQSNAVVQGNKYLGTQDVVVVDVHVGAGSGVGLGQMVLGGHAGLVCVGQSCVVCAKHTMSGAQSPADVQGSGMHLEIVSGSHAGWVHVSPGAQAIAGQGVTTVVVSHE